MNTFLINLDERPDRLSFMQKQLGATGIKATRISAVNGLGAEDIGYPEHHPRLSKGEYACYLSHVICWKALVESGAPHGLILEDDVVLTPNFKDYLTHAAFFDHSGCLTRLECRPWRAVVSAKCYHSFKGVRLRRLMAYEGGAGAYVLTRRYAMYLLKHHAEPKIPVDDLMFDHTQTSFKPHKVYQLDPAPATQRLFLSSKSDHFEPESDLQANRRAPLELEPTSSIIVRFGYALRLRAQNMRRNLFYITKIIRFLGTS